MKIIGTLTVKNELKNSHTSVAFTKPLEHYRFSILEKSVTGDYLCVVFDGDEALGIADVDARDAGEFKKRNDVDIAVAAVEAMAAILAAAAGRTEEE